MLTKLLKIATLVSAISPFHVRAETVPGSTFHISIDKILKVDDTDLPYIPKSEKVTKLDGSYSAAVGLGQVLVGGLEIGAEIGYRSEKQKLKDGITFTQMVPVAAGLVPVTVESLEYQNKMITGLVKVSYYFDMGMFNPYIAVGAGGVRTSVNLKLKKTISGTASDDDFNDVIKKFKTAGSAEVGLLMGVSEDMSVGIAGQYFIVAPLAKEDIDPKYAKEKLLEYGKDLVKMQINTREWSVKGVLKIFI